MAIAVCLKWVPLRVEVDPLTGRVSISEQEYGLSAADEAALEWALRLSDAWHEPIVAVTAGGLSSNGALRMAGMFGVERLVRVDMNPEATSAAVAVGLASAIRESSVVMCGDYSVDRGSGSVPAFVAAELDSVQALGLVAIDVGLESQLNVVRRLDGGRRERLEVTSRAVLSVEGSTTRLRRAGLYGVVESGRHPIEVVRADGFINRQVHERRPFRPRARELAGPVGLSPFDRVRAVVSGPATTRSAPVHLAPAEAADLIVAKLAEWGYLPEAD